MALSLGSALATRVYLGATEINLAYFGANQVYTSSAFSAEAQDYFDRLDTAGDTTYTAYKQPLANYIDSLVTLGGAYWDDMGSAASFVGVGIQGITVPLRDGMTVPTQSNFVAADLDQLTGLKGDAATKLINTNVAGNSVSINDVSFSCYTTERGTSGRQYLSSFDKQVLQAGFTIPQRFTLKAQSGTAVNIDSTTDSVGFIGLSRDNSADFNCYVMDREVTQVEASSDTGTTDFSLFAFRPLAPTGYNNCRISTYHIGPALNLATLEGLQETLLSEVAAAKGAAAAANYFARLDTAGDTIYVPYKQPLTNYISSLVALGGAYWDDLESAASFVGVGIQGITVPLRDGMPTLTNNNFVAGDLNQLTGLKGDGSTKYIGTGITGSDLSLNDHSLSVYLTADRETGTNRYISGAATTFTVFGNTTGFRARSASTTLSTLGSSTATGELIGISRNNSADYDWSYETTGTQSSTSSFINNVDINVYADSGGSNKTAARLATYHVGPALDLATLEGLQDTLLAEIAGIGFSTEAANYFSRLVNAGDTTFLAYRQPLANYIDSLVALGGAYWDDMGSAASFVGVGIQGVTVPLKSTMTALTNNNFVAGDLDPLTGLKGDGSTKYLDTGSKFNDFPQDDFSMSANITEFIQETTDGNYLIYQSFGNGISQIATQNDQGVNPNNLITRCNTRNGENNFDIGSLEDLYGINRTVSTEYSVQYGASSKTVTESSQAPANQIISILGASTEVKSNARMATYHIGPALNLATLRGLQDTLITEIAAI